MLKGIIPLEQWDTDHPFYTHLRQLTRQFGEEYPSFDVPEKQMQKMLLLEQQKEQLQLQEESTKVENLLNM